MQYNRKNQEGHWFDSYRNGKSWEALAEAAQVSTKGLRDAMLGKSIPSPAMVAFAAVALALSYEEAVGFFWHCGFALEGGPEQMAVIRHVIRRQGSADGKLQALGEAGVMPRGWRAWHQDG